MASIIAEIILTSRRMRTAKVGIRVIPGIFSAYPIRLRQFLRNHRNNVHFVACFRSDREPDIRHGAYLDRANFRLQSAHHFRLSGRRRNLPVPKESHQQRRTQ